MSTVVTQLIIDPRGAEEGSQRYVGAMSKAAAASAGALSAEARLQAAMDKHAVASDAVVRGMNAVQAQADRIAQAQARATAAYAASARASNDNVEALRKQSNSYAEAGKLAAAHPVLVLAGSVAAARALAGLATSAAGSLGAASASTAAFAEGAAGMGAAVVAGATLASRGLSGLSTGATAAAAGLSTYAEKVAGFTTATSLLSRGLSLIPPLFLPIAAAFVAFEVGASVIGKASTDLDRLIALGERAEKLDLSAGFVKSFEGLGTGIRATTDQMDSALAKASSFLKDSWGSGNALSKLFNEISATGAAGASGLQATALSDTATTTEERIRAALAGMKELDELGLHLASLQVGEKVFGPEFMERVRTGQTSISQIVADLQEASGAQVLDQSQVDRAVATNRAIADTKQAISDALAVTFDWSAAGQVLNEIWLKILQGVLAVVDAINSGIGAVTSFGAAVASSIGGAFDAVRDKAAGLLSQLGIISAQQKAVEVQGPVDSSYGPQQPTITGRSFPYTFGPELPRQAQAAAGAAKQAGQAAQQAVSSYDQLIQRTKDRIDELDLETRSVGQSNEAVIKLKLAHDLERAAKKDGTTVTDEMRAANDRLGTSLAASTDNLAKAKRGLELTREAQRELADDFGQFADDVILGGKKMGEAFADLSKTLASSSLKALLTGQGGLAGLFGTAGEKSGDIGGLLGGKINLGGLFDQDKITNALGIGAESGIGKALGDALKPSKAGGGILSSPLGGAVASIGAGASIGYSSQSPLMGALGGGLAGLATGNPALEIAGPRCGRGATFGKPAKSKPKQESSDNDRDQRDRAA